MSKCQGQWAIWLAIFEKYVLICRVVNKRITMSTIIELLVLIAVTANVYIQYSWWNEDKKRNKYE